MTNVRQNSYNRENYHEKRKKRRLLNCVYRRGDRTDDPDMLLPARSDIDKRRTRNRPSNENQYRNRHIQVPSAGFMDDPGTRPHTHHGICDDENRQGIRTTPQRRAAVVVHRNSDISASAAEPRRRLHHLMLCRDGRLYIRLRAPFPQDRARDCPGRRFIPAVRRTHRVQVLGEHTLPLHLPEEAP